jgi:hypothetical protein
MRIVHHEMDSSDPEKDSLSITYSPTSLEKQHPGLIVCRLTCDGWSIGYILIILFLLI